MIANTTLTRVAERAASLVDEVQRVYVGPRHVTELLLVALVARGHVLLEGVPGVAKTTLCKAFAATLGLNFRRVQFTPDLMPSDITGTYVLSPREGTFQMREGPIFTNVLLADEINRAPAKTQSALLEAMQEKQSTIEGETRALPSPFIVLATQNPVEQAGTYPLPEAQIDRFLFRLVLGYPSANDERNMLRRFLGQAEAPRKVLAPDEIMSMQEMIQHVHVEEELVDYVVRLATFTRQHTKLYLGVSPRASLALVHACQARALLAGRTHVIPDDIKVLVAPALAHRMMLTPEAEMEGTQREAVLKQAIDQVPYRREARSGA